MKNFIKVIISVIVLSLTVSCTLYKEIPIEVLRPKIIHLPSGTDAAIIYRNFKYENDTLEHYYRDDYQLRADRKNEGINIDSIAVSGCLTSLAANLESYAIFNNIILLPSQTLPRISGSHLSPLPAAVIRNFGTNTGSSYIISLETISYMYASYSQSVAQESSREVIMAGIWAVYDAKSGNIKQHESVVDTLYWYKTDDTGMRIDLPPRVVALELAAGVFGENYAKKFISDWETVQRILIIPPLQEFKTAADHVARDEWVQAAAIWDRFTAKRYGRLAISAHYNMALASELQDDIDSALHRLDQALELATGMRNKEDILMILNYQKVLNLRKKEIGQFIKGGND